MASHGGTKEEMLAARAALEFSLSNAISSAEGAAARLTFDQSLAEVNNRVTSLDKLAEDVSRARSRGYIWGADLEQKLGEVRTMARQAVDTARAESQKAARELKSRADQTLARANKLRGRPAHTIEYEINALSSEAGGLSSAIDAAERRIQESVRAFVQGVDGLSARLTRVAFTLDCFEKASFRLQPEENPVMAVKATWEDSPQGEREGVLLFTAHRIRFEHQEEVVLERSFLIFASRTEMRRALLLDGLIGQLASSDDTERGVLFKDQLLVLSFRQGQNLPQKATFEVQEVTAKEVDTLIEQLRSGDLARTRYQGPMPEASNVGVPVRWPSRCENCGAALTPPVRGQNLIACEYCNAQHPVELGQA